MRIRIHPTAAAAAVIVLAAAAVVVTARPAPASAAPRPSSDTAGAAGAAAASSATPLTAPTAVTAPPQPRGSSAIDLLTDVVAAGDGWIVAVDTDGRAAPPTGSTPSPLLHTMEQRTCGWVTCTVYFTWNETRRMRSYAGAAAVLGGVCAVWLPACVIAAAAYAFWAGQASNAVGDHRCLKIKFPTMEPGTYPNGQRVCHAR